MHLRGVVVGLFVLVTGLFWTFGAVGAPGAPTEERAFTERAAAERSSAGLAQYAVAADLVDVARAHAARMAGEGRLYHNPALGSQVQDWQSVGENVGVGASVDDVHQAFMASSSHRAVLLSTNFTQVGMGVAFSSDGRMWVAQVFRRPAEAKAAPALAPAAESAPGTSTSTARAPKPSRASVDSGATEARAARAAAEAEARRAADEQAARDAEAAAAAEAAERAAAAADEASLAALRDRLAADLVGAEPDPPRRAVPATVLPGPSPAGREVTVPIGVAASSLLAVVLGLLAEVSSRYPLSDRRRQRSQASMSSSRSPSSTAWTLPVS